MHCRKHTLGTALKDAIPTAGVVAVQAFGRYGVRSKAVSTTDKPPFVHIASHCLSWRTSSERQTIRRTGLLP